MRLMFAMVPGTWEELLVLLLPRGKTMAVLRTALEHTAVALASSEDSEDHITGYGSFCLQFCRTLKGDSF